LQAEIDKKGEEEISKIIETAKNEAEKVIVEANARAHALKVERTKTLMRELDAKEKAELAVLRMSRRGEILRIRHELTNRAFNEAERRITAIAEKGGLDYRQLLSDLILQGVSKLKGNKFVVKTNSRDREIIKKDLTAILEEAAKIKNTKVQLELQPLSRTVLGGVILSTDEGTQHYNNTLEARLSATTQNLAGEIHRILQGG
jgi:vacuolar-type H+-ATPase subunit E/Vma4